MTKCEASVADRRLTACRGGGAACPLTQDVRGVSTPGTASASSPCHRSRTPGISCERPIRSTLVSFIPLFDCTVRKAPRAVKSHVWVALPSPPLRLSRGYTPAANLVSRHRSPRPSRADRAVVLLPPTLEAYLSAPAQLARPVRVGKP